MIRYPSSSGRNRNLFRMIIGQPLMPDNRLGEGGAVKVFFSVRREDQVRPAANLRIILAAVWGKLIGNLTDEDTIESIKENCYTQYFAEGAPYRRSRFWFQAMRRNPQAPGEAGSVRLMVPMIRQAHQLKSTIYRQTNYYDNEKRL